VGNSIPTGVGGDGIRRIGDQSNLVGFYGFDELKEVLAGVTFDVEFGGYGF